jgi:hypothetical protein
MFDAVLMRFGGVACAFVLGAGILSTPVAANAAGARFCEQYASTTADVVSDALKTNPECLDYSKGVHSDYTMHFNWCRQNSRDTVTGAADHIRDLVSRCTAAAAPPVKKKKAKAEDVDLTDRGCPMVGFSLPSEVPATIHFANSAFRTLKIYWLDFKGNRKLYKTLRHGQDYVQPTYAKHMWIAVDETGTCVDGAFIAKPGENLAEFFGD